MSRTLNQGRDSAQDGCSPWLVLADSVNRCTWTQDLAYLDAELLPFPPYPDILEHSFKTSLLWLLHKCNKFYLSVSLYLFGSLSLPRFLLQGFPKWGSLYSSSFISSAARPWRSHDHSFRSRWTSSYTKSQYRPGRVTTAFRGDQSKPWNISSKGKKEGVEGSKQKITLSQRFLEGE